MLKQSSFSDQQRIGDLPKSNTTTLTTTQQQRQQTTTTSTGGEANGVTFTRMPAKPRKQPLFQSSLPVVRATADLTLSRPPRLTYGYSCISGSFRDYASGSSNRASDRIFYVDSFTGNNEVAFFGCIEGGGFYGARIAAWIADILPDMISTIAITTAKKKKKKHEDAAGGGGGGTGGSPTEQQLPKLKATSGGAAGKMERDQHESVLKVSNAATKILQSIRISKPITDRDNEKDPITIALVNAGVLDVKTGSGSSGGSGATTSGNTASSSNNTNKDQLTRVQVRVGEILRDSIKATNQDLRDKTNSLLSSSLGRRGAGGGGGRDNDDDDSSGSSSGAGARSSAVKELDAIASGASLCACIVRGRTLAVAHVGTVRAVLGRAVDATSLRATAEMFTLESHRAVVAASAARSEEQILAGEGIDDDTVIAAINGGRNTNTHGSSSSSGANSSRNDKYSKMSTTARLARLTRDVGAMDLASTGTGSTPPATTGVGRRSSSTSSATAATSSTQQQQQRLLLLTSQSIPNFPDAPPIIESALSNAKNTYVKPSQILQLQRKELVRTIKSVTGGAQNTTTGIGSSTTNSSARGSSGSISFNTSLTTTNMKNITNNSTNNTNRSPATTTNYLDPSFDIDSALLDGDISDNTKTQLYEALEVRDMTKRISSAKFDYSGRLVVADPTGIVSKLTRSSKSLSSSSSGVADEGGDAETNDDASNVTGDTTLAAAVTTTTTNSKDTKSSAVVLATRALVPLHSKASTNSYGSHNNHNHHNNDDESGGPPVDLSVIPHEWVSTEIGTAVAEKFAQAAEVAARTERLRNKHNISSSAVAAAAMTTEGRSNNNHHHDGDDNDDDGGAAGVLRDARQFDSNGKPIGILVGVTLTMDHRPDRPDEKERILRCGGRVELGMYSNGTRGSLPRVFGSTNDGPGIAMSRCMGYFAGSKLGISCEPDVHVRVLEPSDRFIILASDGLWSVLSSDEAVRIVARISASILWGGTGKQQQKQNTMSSQDLKSVDSTTNTTNNNNNKEEDVTQQSNTASSSIGAEFSTAFALTSLGYPLTPHPASLAIAANPTLASRPTLPYLEHPAPQAHIPPYPGMEFRISVCAGAAPVAGCGGGSSSGSSNGSNSNGDDDDKSGGGGSADAPLDLEESVTPVEIRKAQQDRLRRVSISAAEALVSAAKARWIAATTPKQRSFNNSSRATNGGGIFDDISVLVVFFDHVKK